MIKKHETTRKSHLHQQPKEAIFFFNFLFVDEGDGEGPFYI